MEIKDITPARHSLPHSYEFVKVTQVGSREVSTILDKEKDSYETICFQLGRKAMGEDYESWAATREEALEQHEHWVQALAGTAPEDTPDLPESIQESQQRFFPAVGDVAYVEGQGKALVVEIDADQFGMKATRTGEEQKRPINMLGVLVQTKEPGATFHRWEPDRNLDLYYGDLERVRYFERGGKRHPVEVGYTRSPDGPMVIFLVPDHEGVDLPESSWRHAFLTRGSQFAFVFDVYELVGWVTGDTNTLEDLEVEAQNGMGEPQTWVGADLMNFEELRYRGHDGLWHWLKWNEDGELYDGGTWDDAAALPDLPEATNAWGPAPGPARSVGWRPDVQHFEFRRFTHQTDTGLVSVDAYTCFHQGGLGAHWHWILRHDGKLIDHGVEQTEEEAKLAAERDARFNAFEIAQDLANPGEHGQEDLPESENFPMERAIALLAAQGWQDFTTDDGLTVAANGRAPKGDISAYFEAEDGQVWLTLENIDGRPASHANVGYAPHDGEGEAMMSIDIQWPEAPDPWSVLSRLMPDDGAEGVDLPEGIGFWGGGPPDEPEPYEPAPGAITLHRGDKVSTGDGQTNLFYVDWKNYGQDGFQPDEDGHGAPYPKDYRIYVAETPDKEAQRYGYEVADIIAINGQPVEFSEDESVDEPVFYPRQDFQPAPHEVDLPENAPRVQWRRADSGTRYQTARLGPYNLHCWPADDNIPGTVDGNWMYSVTSGSEISPDVHDYSYRFSEEAAKAAAIEAAQKEDAQQRSEMPDLPESLLDEELADAGTPASWAEALGCKYDGDMMNKWWQFTIYHDGPAHGATFMVKMELGHAGVIKVYQDTVRRFGGVVEATGGFQVEATFDGGHFIDYFGPFPTREAAEAAIKELDGRYHVENRIWYTEDQDGAPLVFRLQRHVSGEPTPFAEWRGEHGFDSYDNVDLPEAESPVAIEVLANGDYVDWIGPFPSEAEAWAGLKATLPLEGPFSGWFINPDEGLEFRVHHLMDLDQDSITPIPLEQWKAEHGFGVESEGGVDLPETSTLADHLLG